VRKILTIASCLLATGVMAQTGGSNAFDFLNLPTHARLAALGGVNVSLADRDINFLHNNPALAGDTLSGSASAGYQFYVGGVGNALFSYAHTFKKAGQFLVGIQHTNYGSIQGFDETGTETFDYRSGETAVLIGRTHQLGNFRLGANIKAVFSNIAGYRSSAVMLDMGGLFKHPSQDLMFGLVLKNMGVILSEYSETSTSRLPFDVQAGVTLKPEYMPLRFSITGYHLVESDLLSHGTTDMENPSVLKKIFSHVNAGAEILLHRNVNAMVGYNYLLHQALITQTGGSGAGICFGFSIYVKPVDFVFSRSAYTIGNAGYSFTLATNMNQLLKRRN
jgi:hypothetical protein